MPPSLTVLSAACILALPFALVGLIIMSKRKKTPQKISPPKPDPYDADSPKYTEADRLAEEMLKPKYQVVIYTYDEGTLYTDPFEPKITVEWKGAKKLWDSKYLAKLYVNHCYHRGFFEGSGIQVPVRSVKSTCISEVK